MFYDNLKVACNKNNITPSELLRELKMSTGNTGRWKNGGVPSAEVLQKFSERLNVSVDFLLTGKEKSPSNDEELENVITWHRDGKTTTKQLTKEQMKFLEKMIEAMDDDVPDYL